MKKYFVCLFHILILRIILFADPGSWILSVDIDPIDDSKIVYATLFADTLETLHIRSKDGRNEVFVCWEEYLGSEVFVISRIDKEDALTQQWNISTDNTASFYPDNVNGLLEKLISAERFVTRTTPYAENTKTAIFYLDGLKQIIKEHNDVFQLKIETPELEGN